MNQEERRKTFLKMLFDKIKDNFLRVDKITTIDVHEGFNTREEKTITNGYISITNDGVEVINLNKKKPSLSSIRTPCIEDNNELNITIEFIFKKPKEVKK